MSQKFLTCHAKIDILRNMEMRARGRPRTAAPDQKRKAARERQQERRRRLAEDGGRSISLAVPGDLLEALDVEAKQRGISRTALLIQCARTEIVGSGTPQRPGSADSGGQIQRSHTADSDPAAEINRSEPPPERLQQIQPTQIPGSGPRYRGRALLLAAAVGAALGSWATLLVR